jgi:hypothetical protein
MVQLFWLCVIGTLVLAAGFWAYIDDAMVRWSLIGSLLLSSACFAIFVGRGLRRVQRERRFLREHGAFLAFDFAGGARSLDERGKVRGQLHCLRSREERDHWLAAGASGSKRRAVAARQLPAGWSVLEACAPPAEVVSEESSVYVLATAAAPEAPPEAATESGPANEDDAGAEAPAEPTPVS